MEDVSHVNLHILPASGHFAPCDRRRKSETGSCAERSGTVIQVTVAGNPAAVPSDYLVGGGRLRCRATSRAWTRRRRPPASTCSNNCGSCRGRFSDRTSRPLEHDPEKAWPGLDPGWAPVFGKSLPSGLTRGIMLQA